MQFSTSLYFGFKKNLFEIILVVYYDNRTGALHPSQNHLFQHFKNFSVTKGQKKKVCKNGSLPAFICYS